MSPLIAFGVLAVAAMVIMRILEERSRWFTFALAALCATGSVYSFLWNAWILGAVEAAWGMVALRRWHEAGAGPAEG